MRLASMTVSQTFSSPGFSFRLHFSKHRPQSKDLWLSLLGSSPMPWSIRSHSFVTFSITFSFFPSKSQNSPWPTQFIAHLSTLVPNVVRQANFRKGALILYINKAGCFIMDKRIDFEFMGYVLERY